MHLWVIRHGEAASLPMEEEGPPLNERGVEMVEKMAELIQRQKEIPTKLYVSPLLRAIQTAEIFNKRWNLDPKVVNWLKPGVEPSKILNALRDKKEGTVVLVGHLPTLGWLVSTLIWGLPPKEVVLPKASITCLKIDEWEPSGATLRWSLNPELEL
ncbi:MAG: phosphohistidine phosphatase SixA [bacterium]|nr:phosphohistidine phosphatase SixA [bacterium]